MRIRFIIDAFIILLLTSILLVCGVDKSVKNDVVSRSSADQQLIDKLCNEIDEQRKALIRMGVTLDEVRSDIDKAIGDAGKLEGGIDQLKDWFSAVDNLVRELIGAERELEDLQRSIRGEVTGEGSGTSELLRRDYRERERNTKPPAITLTNEDRPRRTNPTGEWGNNFQGGL